MIIDDLGMRKLPHTAAEDLMEVIMRRYERASTLLTSNRPVEDWGTRLGDTAAVTALIEGDHVESIDERGRDEIEPVRMGRAAVQEAKDRAPGGSRLEKAQTQPADHDRARARGLASEA